MGNDRTGTLLPLAVGAFSLLAAGFLVGLMVGEGRGGASRDPRREAPSAGAQELGSLPEGGAPVLEGTHAPLRGTDVRGLAARLAALEDALMRLEAALENTEGLEGRVSLLLEDDDLRALVESYRTRKRMVPAGVSRNVTSAQAQFQQTAKADEDQDGTGEYGGFAEMSGGGKGRMSTILIPPVLASRFQVPGPDGSVVFEGYRYRIFLPDAAGRGVSEPQGGYVAGMVDPDLAETTWCMYAWPDTKHEGMPTFFTNQSGDILQTVDPRYVGAGNGPDADAAFADPGDITSLAANGKVGNDGNTWTQVG